MLNVDCELIWVLTFDCFVMLVTARPSSFMCNILFIMFIVGNECSLGI
jgi:hypothetical protein